MSSYTVTLTDGSVFAVIPDGTLNNDSSMTLIGQNYVGGYGEFQDDNFIRLLETGANSTPPASPLIGQLWYNSVTKQINVFTGNGFKPVNGAASSTSAPTVCSTGDLWFNTTAQTLSVYSGNVWIEVGPSNSGSGITTANIIDTNSVTHLVDQITVSGNIISIISQDGTFVPRTTVPGFAVINPGINLPTIINSQVPIFSGTSTSSRYADLAEKYLSDNDYAEGTVVVFGGSQEVTISTANHSTTVAGIISTKPSYLMNSELLGTNVATVSLTGRVPCQVVGTIVKGDRLVTSDLPGVAQVLDMTSYQPGCIIGKALQDYNSTDVGIIEVAVGRD